MSERLPNSHEHSKEADKELLDKQHEAVKKSIEKGRKARHEHAEKIESIRAKAESEAEKAEKTADQYEKPKSDEQERPMFVNRELKDIAYQRTLKRTRSQLPVPSRALSKFIHNSGVEAVSEVAGKTIARPSGILAGGVVAFLGSSIFLWIARHYGYEYNFLLFALLFVGGFFVGLLLELILRATRRNKSL